MTLPERPLESPKASMRALVVDDVVMIRKQLSEFLMNLGFREVRTTENGREALTHLMDDPTYDVVVTDYQMPELDGFELVKAIRRDARLSHLPIVMVTASRDASLPRRALEVGANEFMLKPLDQDVLRSRLELAGVLTEP